MGMVIKQFDQQLSKTTWIMKGNYDQKIQGITGKGFAAQYHQLRGSGKVQAFSKNSNHAEPVQEKEASL